MTSAPDLKPSIYIIAGPNGAGKTTFANRFLPHYAHCTEFLNADLIAAGLSPFAPEQQNILAGKLMLQRMQSLIEARQTFSFETTLAGRGYASRIPEWREQGYNVILYFLALPAVEFAIERVLNRVRQGGHDIPHPIIRQRFQRGLSNFHQLYRTIVDEWMVLEGSQFPPKEIATWVDGVFSIHDHMQWLQFQI
jgi:predicted ABC-type ATPase